jgi:hypothetical protein
MGAAVESILSQFIFERGGESAPVLRGSIYVLYFYDNQFRSEPSCTVALAKCRACVLRYSAGSMQHAQHVPHTDALIGRLASAFNQLQAAGVHRAKNTHIRRPLLCPHAARPTPCALFAFWPACPLPCFGFVLKFYSSSPGTES